MQERFGTTHWSLIQAAGRNSSTESRRALEELCRAYWYPLYAYLRRQGQSPEDAQDLTQEFFARFLENKYFKVADRERGRFRTFLLTSMKHFLINQWAKARAAKRGAGQVFSIDRDDAETRFFSEPADKGLSPEEAFERSWAAALLERVATRLRSEYAEFGKERVFEQLKDVLSGEKGDVPYADLGQRLGMKEGAVKVAVHRLRHRYQEMLRAEVAQTVGNASELEEEWRHLAKIVAVHGTIAIR
jgi:RNA polymerase sigma-70 factor (ECF subfamily)